MEGEILNFIKHGVLRRLVGQLQDPALRFRQRPSIFRSINLTSTFHRPRLLADQDPTKAPGSFEPQFNEPYFATSLQDFWGCRWNLVVTSILRPTVYEPVRAIGSHLVGRKWAPLPAVFATFVVSAMMHELIFFYLGRVRPNWEISWFFLLHGFCLTAEIAIKKVLNDRWQLPKTISTILTVGFIMSTGFWLFFPKFVEYKVDVRAFEEYAEIGAYMKNVSQSIVRVLPGH
uniref:Wax synthase domain-containing protein n=1 Tax=Salix viminalis TaxID=40686 RepID=A0A6N2LI88_SALVM